MSAKTSTKTSKAVKTQLAKAELVPEQTQTPPPTPVEANVELPTETVEAAETLETGTTMRQRFEVLIKARQDQLLELKREVQELRKMQRDHENAIKDASKKSKKKKLLVTRLTPESHLDLLHRLSLAMNYMHSSNILE